MRSIRTLKRLWFRILPLLMIVCLATGLTGTPVAESADAVTAPGSTICGVKFNDVNGTGDQQTAEPGLPGWTIQLLDAAGNVIATTVTGSANAAGPAGRFCFNAVPAGSYTVREVAQPGWVQTYPTAPGTHSVTVGAGTAPTFLQFGNRQAPGTGVVCATKFEDKNGNGLQDAGEPGLSGWTIQLWFDGSPQLVSTAVTDSKGSACFSVGYPDGGLPYTYHVAEVLKPGWQQTVPGDNTAYTVQVSAAQPQAPVSFFGNRQVPAGSTVCGTKFEDKNGNGVQDPGELGLSGWTIQQMNAAGQAVATAVTDKNGDYCFTGLPRGTYTFAEAMQPGWQQTFPLAPGTHTVTVNGSEGVKGLNYGNMRLPGLGSVCGTKFEDRNGNGVQDPGEPGLGGWTIQITDDKGNVVATVVTRDDGTFCFERLRPGIYTFSEVMQPGWQQTLPGGKGSYTVQLTTEQPNGKPLLFGNIKAPTESLVCGTKFEDKNGNGVQDPGEVGLSGWTIQAKDSAGNVVATAVSDQSGKFCFKGLRPGVYTLAEVMQPGYQQTFPGKPFTHTVRVVGGHYPGSVDFGNQKQPDPCCLSFRFLQGRADNFATADGAEPAQPSTALVQAMPSTAVYTGFDATMSDRFVAHTFTLPAGNCVESASLEFKAKPLSGNTENDTVSLRFAGVPGMPTWGSYLGAGEPSPGLLPSAWDSSNYSAGNVFTLDLASLPGGVNLIPTLNSRRFLDFVVQDDTSVDYALLTVKFCECSGSKPADPVDVNVDKPRQASVTPGVSIRLVVGSGEASVNGESTLLPAPAVLRGGSTLVPFRWIGEKMGAEVQWDQAERRATFALGERKVELWIDRMMARVDGERVMVREAPTLINGVTFVPVRFIVENLGASVSYNPDDRSITITYPK